MISQKRTEARLVVGIVALILFGGHTLAANAAFIQIGKQESARRKPAPVDSAEINYKKGLEFYKTGKYDEALAEFKETIRRNPHHEKAYKKTVDAGKEAGRLDEALNYFEELKTRYPKNSYPYFALGVVFAERKVYQKAIENYQISMQLLPRFALVYFGYASASHASKRLDEAEEFLNGLLKANPQNFYAHYGLAHVYQLQSKWNEALESIDKAILLNPEFVEGYFTKGNIYFSTSRNNDAITIFQDAQELAKKKNDLIMQNKFLGTMGACYANLGNYPSALEYLEKALKLAKECGERIDEGRWLGNVGNVYTYRGQYPQAVEKYQDAMKIAKAVGDKSSEGNWLGNIGNVQVYMGNFPQAIDYFQAASEIASAINDQRAVARQLGNIASVYGYSGDYFKALENHQKALATAEKTGDRVLQFNMNGNIGLDHVQLGNYYEALIYLKRALEEANAVGDRNGKAIFLLNTAHVYVQIGDFQKALQYDQLALKTAREIKADRIVGSCLLNIGFIYWRVANPNQAKEHYAEALEIVRKIGDKKNEGIALANIGLLHYDQGEYAEALKYTEHGLALSKAAGYQYGVGFQLDNLGDINLKLNDISAAAKSYDEALKLGNATKMPEIIWRAHIGLGGVYESQKNDVKALHHYKAAVDSIENVRSKSGIDEMKSVFLQSKIDVYEKLINLLFTLHQKEPAKGYAQEAFDYAERAKARSLLDLLAESKINVRQGIEPALLEREQEIQRNIARLQTDLRNKELTETQRSDIYKKLSLEEEKFADLKFAIRQKSPTYANLKYSQPFSFADVQKRLLTTNDVLLEYSLGEAHSYLWAITKDKIHVYQLPIQKEIVERVKSYLAMISNGTQPGFGSTGMALFEMLLKPANKVLKARPNLIIVPDGILHYLPFEALVSHVEKDAPHFLIEAKNISYAPSASVLGFIKNQKPARSNKREFIAFGDPDFGDETAAQKREAVPPDTALDRETTERGLYEERGFEFKRLPKTAVELEKISSLFAKNAQTIYLRSEAKEERVKTEALQQYRFLHFATHATLDEQTPGRSAIVLTLDNDPTEDGFLQMNEIFNLKLDADLVVLSACQTGRGKLLRGEGVIGMTRAFMYAGARSLLVSLWPVIDESTADFMAKFYGYMKDGKAKNEALRQAKLDLIKGKAPALQHPYFWAPFVLMGNSN